ncbi:YjbQ family protein [candidate division KSB1 bacterium]|nr:YjbQ family protein [candidate division KSB1 bacterium]
MLKEIQVNTNQQVEFVKITSQIQSLIDENNIKEEICHIFVPHTTAGITINEGADPDVVSDMTQELNKIVPFKDNYRHLEGNSAAHIKASMMGSSVSVLIQNGKLQLGTWQAIFFCEFDGPRSRRVWIKF